MKFKKRAPKLTLNETKSDTENASYWDHFGVEVSNKLKCDKKDLFQVSLQNLDFYFNPYLKDKMNISFSAPVYFFQILGNFVLHSEAVFKTIWRWINFWVKSCVFLASEWTSLLLCSKPVLQNYRYFLKIKKRARKLRVNETKTDTENASNGDQFGVDVCNKSKGAAKDLFRVSL